MRGTFQLELQLVASLDIKMVWIAIIAKGTTTKAEKALHT
jgi:hypothetical protein